MGAVAAGAGTAPRARKRKRPPPASAAAAAAGAAGDGPARDPTGAAAAANGAGAPDAPPKSTFKGVSLRRRQSPGRWVAKIKARPRAHPERLPRQHAAWKSRAAALQQSRSHFMSAQVLSVALLREALCRLHVGGGVGATASHRRPRAARPERLLRRVGVSITSP